MDDVIISKCITIEKSLRRIQEEHFNSDWRTNYTKQDSLILNLQRACEAAMDLGLRWLRLKRLGVPQTSRDVFVLLQKAEQIPLPLAHNLQAIVDFRDIAVHDYQKISLDILQGIIENKLNNFIELMQLARQHL